MDIVLVHGAWQGAWCWDRVVPLLQQAGHRVHTPTLTGSGERAAELTPDVTLDDHLADVSAVVDRLDDGPVLLVGHSYAGMVISGAADRLADRVHELVYVDAFYPHDGDCALGLMPQPFQEAFRRSAEADGNGWRLPADDRLLDVWGLHDPDDRRWVRQRLTDWSLPCFETPVRLTRGGRARLARTFLSGTAEDYPARAAFGALAHRAATDGCRVIEVPTGHDMMIEAPREVADLLSAAAGRL